MPQQCDGIRTDPPMSVPSSNDVNPAATAAAGPPDEPPGMRVDVPRVVRRAEDLVEALHVARPARQVRLAEHDRAGLLQPGDGGRVGGRHVVGQLDGAAGRADAGRLDGVLDRDREPVQRRQRSATTRSARRPRRPRRAPGRRRA